MLYFWPDPRAELREIRRVLRPAGTLVLGFCPDGPGASESLPDSVYHLRSVTEVEKILREAGFAETRAAETMSGSLPFVCLRAACPVRPERRQR